MSVIRAGRGPLAERDFALFFYGYVCSLLGSGMTAVVLSFALLHRGGGSGSVGTVLAAETLPMVLLLLVGGVFADRLPSCRVMIAADLLRFASQASMGVLLLTGPTPLAALAGLAALTGIGHAFFIPGRNALVVDLVVPRNLQAANGLCMIAQSAGTICGPILGGLLVGAIGPASAILVDALTYAVSAILLLCIPSTKRPDRPSSLGFLEELAEGWHDFIGRPWVWVIVMQFALLHLLVIGPMLVLGMTLFSRVPEGAALWGGLMSMLGVGSALGGLLALRLQPDRPIYTALMVFLAYALLPGCLAIDCGYLPRAACFMIGGFSFSLFVVLWETTLQRLVPPERLARLASYEAFGALCLLPLGYGLAEPLAALLAPCVVLGLGAALCLASTLLVLSVRVIRDVRPDRPAAQRGRSDATSAV